MGRSLLPDQAPTAHTLVGRRCDGPAAVPGSSSTNGGGRVRLTASVTIRIGVERLRTPARAEVERGAVVFASRGRGRGVDLHAADGVDDPWRSGLLLAEHECSLSMGVLNPSDVQRLLLAVCRSVAGSSHIEG